MKAVPKDKMEGSGGDSLNRDGSIFILLFPLAHTLKGMHPALPSSPLIGLGWS